MAFFKVSFDVAPVQIVIDGTQTRCGFVTNIYAWAASQAAAIAAAKTRLETALEQREKSGKIEFSTAKFKVESVERSYQFWKRIRPEGFAFYRQDEVA